MGSHLTEKDIKAIIHQLKLDNPMMDPEEKVEHSQQSEATDSGDMQSVKVEVINNKVIVHDPDGSGTEAAVRSIQPLKLYVNGMLTEGEAYISANDDIRWEIDETNLYEIEVSEDQLRAVFRLRSRDRYAWELKVSVDEQGIYLFAEEDKNIVSETVQLQDVLAELESRSIVSNLDLAAIQKELLEPTYQPIIVARGKAPVLGSDAQLEIYFAEEIENIFYEVGGVVDYRNHLHIPSVRQGEVIGRKKPMVDGVPGYDVYGKVIMPPPPKDIVIVTKPSVVLTPSGEIVALREGRPRITGTRIKCLDITTSFVVPGNVDLRTGNIVFSGDVVVYGDVEDNMIIESLGNVYVYGSVFNATITATGSIHVRGNVIGSKLYSGYFGVMFNRLFNCAKRLSEKLGTLLEAANMLVHALEEKKQPVRYGQLLLLLIENKFKEIPDYVKELMTVVAHIRHIKKDMERIISCSDMLINPTRLVESGTYSFIHSYGLLLRQAYQDIADMQEQKVTTGINQCQNSELKSNGDIIIHRDGVLISDLFSTGNIVFRYERSVCRGSKLEAGESIVAHIIGGETGAATILKAEKSVAVSKMYAGKVCVGRWWTDIYEPVENRKFTRGNMNYRGTNHAG